MKLVYTDILLHRPSEQIRLLEWIPLENPASVEEIPHYSLKSYNCKDTFEDYIAISYTWGDAQPELPLKINGEVILSVRLNCWHALWQLRHHKIPGKIWIDTICIDQKDNEEKSAQVAMMGDIFGRAGLVAACIGMGDTLDRLRAASTTGSKERSLIIDDLDQTAYFRRLWTKQEFILAKDIRIFCGLGTMAWTEFRDSTTSGKNSNRVSAREVCKDRDNHMTNVAAGAGDSLSFLTLLANYGRCGCVDPRDKIFALRSLLNESDPVQAIVPNYRTSLTSLFLHVHAAYWTGVASNGKVLDNDVNFFQSTLITLLGWFGIEQGIKTYVELLGERIQNTSIPAPLLSDETRLHIQLPIGKLLCIYEMGDYHTWYKLAAPTEDEDKDPLPPKGKTPIFDLSGSSVALTSSFAIPYKLASSNKPISSVAPADEPESQTLRAKLVTSFNALYRGSVFGRERQRTFHRLLVREDTEQGDVIACVKLCKVDSPYIEQQYSFAYAVLKPREGQSGKYDLKSWAVRLRYTVGAPLSRSGSKFNSLQNITENEGLIGELDFDFGDATKIEGGSSFLNTHVDDMLPFIVFCNHEFMWLELPGTMAARTSSASLSDDLCTRVTEVEKSLREIMQS